MAVASTRVSPIRAATTGTGGDRLAVGRDRLAVAAPASAGCLRRRLRIGCPIDRRVSGCAACRSACPWAGPNKPPCRGLWRVASVPAPSSQCKSPTCPYGRPTICPVRPPGSRSGRPSVWSCPAGAGSVERFLDRRRHGIPLLTMDCRHRVAAGHVLSARTGAWLPVVSYAEMDYAAGPHGHPGAKTPAIPSKGSRCSPNFGSACPRAQVNGSPPSPTEVTPSRGTCQSVDTHDTHVPVANLCGY